MIKCVLAFLAAVLLLVGCSGPKPEVPKQPEKKTPDSSGIKIEGDASAPVNKLAIEAIADLQVYWPTNFPSSTARTTSPSRGACTP
ncbi:MAG: putative metalloprotease [Mycobacterium sp.]|nr:putative metalloprotease [Mycobacterium sp.]